jgi:hypothetical protein
MFLAFYCNLIYRNKKVKSFNEGFITKQGNKFLLLNDKKEQIDSMFASSRQLNEDEEMTMDRNFVLIGQDLEKKQVAEPTHHFTAKRKRLSVTLKQVPKPESKRLTLEDVSGDAIILNEKKNTENSEFTSAKSISKSNFEKRQDVSSMSSPKKLLKLNPKRLVAAMQHNDFGLYFNNENPVGKYYRGVEVPPEFKDLASYQSCLKLAIIENMNLDLQQISSIYFKTVLNGGGSDLEQQLRAKGISFYIDVTLSNPSTFTERGGNLNMYISNKQHYTAYSKDDIWIISSSVNFTECQFFKSYFYGPTNNAIELIPLSKNKIYQKWIDSSNTKLYAIKAINANTESSAFSMLDELNTCPIIPSIIKSNNAKYTESLILAGADVILTMLANNAIQEFQLNQDQANVISSFIDVLLHRMKPVLLVHGVYGAGKSHVICVLVLILYRAYNIGILNECSRIVVSSLTNVAVDRILLKLLELEFEDFIRVGSIKKIAKKILPYSLQNRNESQVVKDLTEMMNSSLTSEEEKIYIQKAIKMCESRENNLKLRDAFLIGITTSSCGFDIVQDMDCPIVIVDESSQIPEYVSLLPFIRFKCKYSIMIGDPKQLGPTLTQQFDPSLQGKFGIERTLFERLAHCGFDPILLRIQYRCHPSISNITSQCFYNNQIQNGITRENRKCISNLEPVLFVETTGDARKVKGGSFENMTEAKLITAIIKGILSTNQIEMFEIGVISLCK